MRYQIQGDTLPVVICQLEAGERMITEGGGMSWMSPNMKMETTTNGGIGKAVGRMFSGEKMFQNIYTAQGGNGMIAFASCFPGSIRAFNIRPVHFWQVKREYSCLYISIRKWLPDYLEEKDLFFRKSVDRELHLRNLTDM